jgi:hypothetical protein
MLIAVGSVGAALLALWAYFRWVVPWRTRRDVDRLLRQAEASEVTGYIDRDQERCSGKLAFDASTLSLTAGARPIWTVDSTEIAVVGEYTNGNGPYLDDYFVVFVRRDGSWVQSSFYAVGRDESLAGLGAALGGELVPELCSSVEWKTRVMWPRELLGDALFDLRPVAPKTRWLRLRAYVKLPQLDACFSEAVQTYLAQHGVA